MEDAALRYGLVNKERSDDYLREIEEPYIREALKDKFCPTEIREASDIGQLYAIISNKRAYEDAVYEALDKIEADLQCLMGITQQKWEKLTEPGGAFHDRYLESGKDNPKDFFDSLPSSEQGKASKKELEESPRHKLDDVTPFDQQEIIKIDEIPASGRLRKALAACGMEVAKAEEPLIHYDETRKSYRFNGNLLEDKSTEEKEQILAVVRLMKYMEAENPVSRIPSARFAVVDAEQLMQNENTGTARVEKTEIGNLSGFNNVNQQLGDAVLREFGAIMKQEVLKLDDELRDRVNVHDVGNGRIVIIVMDKFPEETLQTLKDSIQLRIETEIFQEDIRKFAARTYANPKSQGSEKSEKILTSLDQDIERVNTKYQVDMQCLQDIPNPRDPSKHAQVNTEKVDIREDMDYFEKIDEITYAVGERPKQVSMEIEQKRTTHLSGGMQR